MTESKEDVFKQAVLQAAAYDVGKTKDYGSFEEVVKDWHKRFNEATSAEKSLATYFRVMLKLSDEFRHANCPYCHEKHGEGDPVGDLSDVGDASMLIHRDFNGKWIIDTWGTPGAVTPESKPIIYCPMCGRQLEVEDENGRNEATSV